MYHYRTAEPVEAQRSSPERRLLAAVLAQAIRDCSHGNASDAERAYRWISEQRRAIRAYCDLLDIDAGMFARRIVEKHGARCQRFIRERAAKAGH